MYLKLKEQVLRVHCQGGHGVLRETGVGRLQRMGEKRRGPSVLSLVVPGPKSSSPS